MPSYCLVCEKVNKDNTVRLAPSHISIPQPNGVPVNIAMMDVSEATNMLGVLFAPVGIGIPHIEMMQEKRLE